MYQEGFTLTVQVLVAKGKFLLDDCWLQSETLLDILTAMCRSEITIMIESSLRVKILICSLSIAGWDGETVLQSSKTKW